jgi:hypothetical protein
VESGEFGLVVECIHGAGAAVHEELDDTFYFGGVMESAIEIWRRFATRVLGKQVGERDAS